MDNATLETIVSATLEGITAEAYLRYLIEAIEVEQKELMYALESDKMHLVGLHAGRIGELTQQLALVHKQMLQDTQLALL